MQRYEKYHSEYERALLCLAYRESTLLLELEQKITSDYFLHPAHKLIYLALGALLRNPDCKRPDLDLLTIEVEKLGFSKLGLGSEYLLFVTTGKFDPSNFKFFLSKVTDAYIKYSLDVKLEQALTRVRSNASQDAEADGKQLAEEISAETSALGCFTGGEELSTLMGDVVQRFVVERSQHSAEVVGLQTGFPSLDRALNGLMPGSLTVIAGRPKSGKSTVLANVVDYAGIQSTNPVPVLMISTEMYTEEDMARIIAMRTYIEERKISNGTAYNDPALKKVIDGAIKQIRKSKIYHRYLPSFNAPAVVNLIKYHKAKYGIELAVFDYIKMATTGDINRDRREDQILGDMATSLKNVGGELKIPILAACQVNRAGLVADSDRIERYCNTLMEFKPKTLEELEAQDYHKHGTHWLHVRTTRAGGNCKIPIRFWKSCLKLQEAEVWEGELAEEEDSDSDQRFALTTPTEFEKLKAKEYESVIAGGIAKVKANTDIEEEILGTAEEKDDPYF